MATQHETSQAHVLKMLDDIFVRQNFDGGESGGKREHWNFCLNLDEYSWKYIEKKEQLVPRNFGFDREESTQERVQPIFPNSKFLRWNRHNVWIVEGKLKRGESNVLDVRRFYIDDQSWIIVMGDGYDNAGNIVSYYMLNGSLDPDEACRGQWYRMY